MGLWLPGEATWRPARPTPPAPPETVTSFSGPRMRSPQEEPKEGLAQGCLEGGPPRGTTRHLLQLMRHLGFLFSATHPTKPPP